MRRWECRKVRGEIKNRRRDASVWPMGSWREERELRKRWVRITDRLEEFSSVWDLRTANPVSLKPLYFKGILAIVLGRAASGLLNLSDRCKLKWREKMPLLSHLRSKIMFKVWLILTKPSWKPGLHFSMSESTTETSNSMRMVSHKKYKSLRKWCSITQQKISCCCNSLWHKHPLTNEKYRAKWKKN